MTDVVASERPTEGFPNRLSRVRCLHCAMPGDRTMDRCWSCGLDPRGSNGPVQPTPAKTAAIEWDKRSGRRLLVAGVLLAVLVVVTGSMTLLAPAERTEGVRGLAARLRGDAWHRAAVGGASAEFPAVPIGQAVPAALGLAGTGGCLVAGRDGVRAELLVAEVAETGTLLDGGAVAERLVGDYATMNGGRVVQRTPLYLGGAAGVDVVVEASSGTTRIRATVSGTTAYLLAVAGSEASFRRFTQSFRRAP